MQDVSSHVTVLQPGTGYEPHVDPYDVAILLLSRHGRDAQKTISAPTVIYYRAGELHGMRNVGREPSRDLVFEFHPSEKRTSKIDASIVKKRACMLVGLGQLNGL